MFQLVSGRLKNGPYTRRLYASSSNVYSGVHSNSAVRRLGAAVVVASATAAVGTGLYMQKTVYNDIPDASNEKAQKKTVAGTLPSNGGLMDDEHLTALVWGSNKFNVISPETPDVDSIRSPLNVTWLSGVALRDLALHGQHGACVDARGDVYRWGDALNDAEMAGKRGPKLAFRGKDIVGVQLSDSRLFALSSSGKVYVMSSTAVNDEAHPAKQSASKSSWSPMSWLWAEDQPVDFLELSTEEQFKRGEKFVSLSAGNDHMLALTSTGRTFAYPINIKANANGQLGLRKFDIPAPQTTSPFSSRVPVELVPKIVSDPYSKASPYNRVEATPPSTPVAVSVPGVLPGIDDNNLRFCDRLFEVPSLKGIRVAQAVAGGRTSFVRTIEEGRVLGWGANEYGQLGLGSTMTIDTITIPTEVVLSRSRTRSRCVHIETGGDLTYFMVERRSDTSCPTVDVLACGMGQWGGLGNGLYSSAQGVPVKVKAVSGLVEYSEETQDLQAITPHAISASPTGHVLLTLDTLARAGPGGGGRDLLVWGFNRDYQLGNSKRTSLATPANLEVPGGGRLMMMKRTAEVKDMQGRRWARGVEVEQRAIAGFGASLVYWKIC